MKKTQLFGFWIMILLLVGISSMGVVYSNTPIRSERLVISPEEGFLEIKFGASSGVMRELLGYPTGVFLIGLNQVHVYGNRAMFFFERDQMYKYVLSMSVLNQHLTDYSDETWPFEDTAFFFPSFDVTLGGVYRDIKNRIGTERGLEIPGNVIAIQTDAVEVQFRFTPFQEENAYLLSEIVVKKN